MATWEDYKKYTRDNSPILGKDLDEIEGLSKIIGAMIKQRHDMELSQRELAEMCGIPHSSIARIEAGRTTPNLGTLLNIFSHLGLTLDVSPTAQIAHN